MPAAAVFSSLRRLPLPRRMVASLELESGLNDAPVILLVLALSDADGRQLGVRRFLPRDYLGNAPKDALLAPGQATQLAFDIVEPAPGVVAFDFRFE